MEAFSANLNYLLAGGSCDPYKLPRGSPIISHLLYADDMLVFLNSVQSSLSAAKNFLQLFQSATGLKKNNRKNNFLFSKHIRASRIRASERILGFSKAGNDIQYLGAPLSKARTKVADFQFIIDKVNRRVNGWSASHVSQAGRATLIRRVLESFSIHVMAAMHIPCQVIDCLESHFASFFWGWVDGKWKLHWIAWKKIVKPVDEGELSIRSLKEVMAALRLKLTWAVKFGENSGSWVSLMRAKHHRDLTAEIHASSQKITSPFRRKIRTFLPVLTENVQWQVGRGELNLWAYNWTGMGPLQ
ncbi:uncharacterized protein LOC131242010 [Magnolia sinica]|uniref:uncharacterized protein LOC131242010 n=1 Tax=Magnolia sinica TaxID=86752 RepID=UPI00265B3513|nr:uncharacterized protein LOC131242010 [Magnolia sinica]